jgi:dihydroneopterin aldolase
VAVSRAGGWDLRVRCSHAAAGRVTASEWHTVSAGERERNAMASGDEVFVQGLECYGYHGVHPEERRLGQRFSVDVTVGLSLRDAAASDEASQTVSYSQVAKLARAVVEGTPRNLIETVAEEIAGTILAEFPRAESVAVTLRKPNAPIKETIFSAAGVRIRRTREQHS